MRVRLATVAALAAGGALLWLERRRPLRRRIEPAMRHDLRNLAIAGLAAAAVRLVERPVVEPLAALVARRRWGVLPALGLPRTAERLLALALLDYTLHLWHILTHRLPLLWRLHRVHHADLDLTATTALRFHAMELLLSVPWRAAQVAAIGVGGSTLRLWQRATLASILFHHSNLRLPEGVDRLLAGILMTPRLHGIHHSSRPGEMNTNWSSGLTVWDRLHRTLRQDVPQEAIVIGAPDEPPAADLVLPRLLTLPLR